MHYGIEEFAVGSHSNRTDIRQLFPLLFHIIGAIFRALGSRALPKIRSTIKLSGLIYMTVRIWKAIHIVDVL